MLNSKTVTVIYIWAKREDIENITEPTIIHGSEVETQRDWSSYYYGNKRTEINVPHFY